MKNGNHVIDYLKNIINFKEAEEAARAKQEALERHRHPPPHTTITDTGPDIVKSPSDFSCHSYELFVGQEKGHDDNNKEKMSIRSEGLDSVSEQRRVLTNPTKIRKVSAVSVLIFIESPLENR